MPTLKVMSTASMPAFQLSVSNSDSTTDVTKAAAKKAHIVGPKGLHYHNTMVLRHHDAGEVVFKLTHPRMCARDFLQGVVPSHWRCCEKSRSERRARATATVFGSQ